MSKKLIYLVSFVFVLSVALMGTARAELVAQWRFDEGSGTIASDTSGNGNDGVLEGDAKWVAGQLGGAIEFNGSNARVVAPNIPLDSRSFTLTMWVNAVLYTGEQVVFSTGLTGANDTDMHFRLGGPGSGNVPPGGVRMGFYNNDIDTVGDLILENEWYHLTFWYDFENQNRRIYINGVMEAEAGAAPYLGTTGDSVIGAWGTGQWFQGMIDDVRIYDCVLDENQIQSLISPSPSLPSLNPLSDALDTSLSFTTGGNADWFGQRTTSFYDGDAAQSGDIKRERESWLQTTVSGKGTVSFFWKVSSEYLFDLLEFYIDGSLQDKISGSADWHQMTYEITDSDAHILEWRYVKDVGTDSGSDCGWVDKVMWMPAP